MDTLTQNHLVTLRQLLSYRLRDLRSEIDAESGAARMTADASLDAREREAMASEAQRSAIDAAETARDADELAGVEAALHRLDSNQYGDCMDCGNPIALQRLLVQPAATRCASCQSAYEARERRKAAP
jgi:RNA polymerase-binding transcription factor DksA